MLYVFHVDMGRMMSFDMSFAVSSVDNLKETIERSHGIPAANIVLLVSGGEMLTKSTQVSYYSAGTDTNPIYMFLTGDHKLPKSVTPVEVDVDLDKQVERSRELPAIYETVVTRAQLAQKMYDLAREEDKLCERLVHEQHLQQQGWSAVVANMEDLTEEFSQRLKKFCTAFDYHLAKRSKYLELLENFGEDLKRLSRIPILPGLTAMAEEDFHGFDEFLDTDEVFARSQQHESVLMCAGASAADIDVDGGDNCEISDTDKSISTTSPNKKLKMGSEPDDERTSTSQTSTTSSSNQKQRSLTLLQWISAKENHNALHLMAEECSQGLRAFNEIVYEKLRTEVQSIIKMANQSDVKEIKGLSGRLCKLELFIHKIKKMVQDQKELSTSFQQNQNRAINLRDASILPDLCASHKSQLLVMLQNHQKIGEHRRCIAKAKDELGVNLYARLKRIVVIENAMSELDNNLLFYHRCMRRVERHINIIEQIHQAPYIYVAAVTEVVRRKIFSGEFRQWASKLAEDFDSIYCEEIKRRQLFNASFEGHFLNILFPGMNDMPPAFANENPLVFDARLPNITRSDIDMLSSHLPELTSHVELPDMGPVINFFISRSGEHQKERLEELLKLHTTAFASQAAATQKLAQHQRVGELQKEAATTTAAVATAGATAAAWDESETDTEEFEKVVKSEVVATGVHTTHTATTSTTDIRAEMMARSTTMDTLPMQSVETLTEDNACATRAEVERLRSTLGALSTLSVDCLRLARTNLRSLRDNVERRQDDLKAELLALNGQWHEACSGTEAKIRHDVQKICDLQTQLSESEAELQRLASDMREKERLDAELVALRAQVAQLQAQLESGAMEKERAIIETSEKLTQQHRINIDTLLQRLRTITATDLALTIGEEEGVDADANACVEANTHTDGDDRQVELLWTQIRANLIALKDKAVAAAIALERSKWQLKSFPTSLESAATSVCVLKDIIEEKEKQLDMLRDKDVVLTKENYQLKTRLNLLMDDEGNSWLKEKIDYLSRDKCRLEEELRAEKSRRLEMETSVAALRSSMCEQQQQAQQQTETTLTVESSKLSNSSQRPMIAVESCSKDDVVVVVWSMRFGQFLVVQNSQSLYFVHSDCLTGLNLRLPDESVTLGENIATIPMPYYAIGRVVDKEYCQAKKEENRYRVKKGAKFYRVKLAPLTSKHALRRERAESCITTISRSVSQTRTASASNAIVALRCRSALMDSVDAPMVATLAGELAAASATPLIMMATSPPTIMYGGGGGGGDGGGGGAARGVGGGVGRFKERTISITSVTEEDDNDELGGTLMGGLGQRSRYISVSEEDESLTNESPAALGVQQQQSVITEQPTASSTNLKLNLMLASADIPHVISCKTTATTTMTAVSTSPRSSPGSAASATVTIAPMTGCCSPSPPIIMDAVHDDNGNDNVLCPTGGQDTSSRPQSE